MIREIFPKDHDLVFQFVEKDIARNYFILLGLKDKRQVYDRIYGEYVEDELKAILFKRKSGILQFFALGQFDLNGFVNLISTLQYTGLIGPKSYCNNFIDRGLFQFAKDGACISKLNKNSKIELINSKYKTSKISVGDLDEIVELYKDTFSSFASKEMMEEKLNTKRGRGICIEENGEIVSVIQTDFETSDAAVIVGIATRKDYRAKGLATECLKILSKSLINEGKDLYLQYDNLEAGKIYEKLGFKIIDHVIHLNKKEF